MPAKKLTEWVVTAGATTEDAAKEILDRLGGKAFGVISKKTSYVCPHPECGKPWPMEYWPPTTRVATPEPLKTYAEAARELNRQYCCEATRIDCEDANG